MSAVAPTAMSASTASWAGRTLRSHVLVLTLVLMMAAVFWVLASMGMTPAELLLWPTGAIAFVVGVRLVACAVRGPRYDLGLWLSGAWLCVIALTAAVADLLPLAEARNVAAALHEPILQGPELLSQHPLGTDRQGLDVLGGLVYGARVSLVVGIGGVALGFFVGGAIGTIGGYLRGGLDAFTNILANAMLAFPPLVLLMAMVTVLDANVRNVTLALALLGIPTYIRLARANTLTFAEREFVLSARAIGERERSIVVREVVPNVVLAMLSFAFVMVAVLIVAEASLSFLGLSVPRPTPTWGNMIAAGQRDVSDHPHLVAFPGLALFFTVFAFNVVGDRARRAWDPRTANL